MLCDAGARPGGSLHYTDAVGVSWDASLVVPCPERRRRRRGPDAVAAPCVARHAIDATSARRRGGGGLSPLDSVSTATSSPRCTRHTG